MQNLFSLLILVSLVQRIRSDWDYVTTQEEIATKLRLKYNFNESLGTNGITTAITVDDETFNDYELKKLFVKMFKLYTHSEKKEHKSKPPHTMSPRRKARAVENITEPLYEMKCLACYANGSTKHDEKCYQGVKIPAKRCADAEYCFTEIHPLYLKRGCIFSERVNRTFVCNCPLCNDKPASESINYEYTRISDWAYDNVRLSKPLNSMQLPCKVCETKGSDVNLDNSCRSGKNSNYMVCGPNQICYTNIDDETDFVSRGCIDRVVYNSMYYFCKNAVCNNAKFFNPRLRIGEEEILVKGKTSYLKRALDLNRTKLLPSQRSYSSVHDLDLSLIVLVFAKCYNEFVYNLRMAI